MEESKQPGQVPALELSKVTATNETAKTKLGERLVKQITMKNADKTAAAASPKDGSSGLPSSAGSRSTKNAMAQMTDEQLRKFVQENISTIGEVNPDLLNSEVFSKNKNIAFATMKEFFIKYAREEMTNEKLSEMLSTDVNNLFFHVKHQTQKNDDAIKRIRGAQVADKTVIDNMKSQFDRLNAQTKNTLAQEKREKVRYSDLDAVKQNTLNIQSYLSDKLNMLNSRMIEFDVRANRLEDHCFKKQEPVVNMVNKRFNELKTEMYYRIENFQTQLQNFTERIESYDQTLKRFEVTQENHYERIKKLADEQYLQKRLNENRNSELKALSRDVAEIDHRYKKQICLMSTDLPMQMTKLAHQIISHGIKSQNDLIIKKLVSLNQATPKGGVGGAARNVILQEENKKKEQELLQAQTMLISKIDKNAKDMNKKLEKNKVARVTEFIERQETQRIQTLRNDFESENQNHPLITQSVLGSNKQLKTIMIAKHKTDIMREMLHSTHIINIDEISLHTSDGSDILSSTEKKLSETQRQIESRLSRSSLALSKVSIRQNEDDYFQSNVVNEYSKHAKKTITVEGTDGQRRLVAGGAQNKAGSKPGSAKHLEVVSAENSESSFSSQQLSSDQQSEEGKVFDINQSKGNQNEMNKTNQTDPQRQKTEEGLSTKEEPEQSVQHRESFRRTKTGLQQDGLDHKTTRKETQKSGVSSRRQRLIKKHSAAKSKDREATQNGGFRKRASTVDHENSMNLRTSNQSKRVEKQASRKSSTKNRALENELVEKQPTLLVKGQSRVRDSAKQLEKIQRIMKEEEGLIEAAGGVIRSDAGIEQEIQKKFEQFESDGESDAEDLEKRFENFCKEARDGFAEDIDFIIEIKNHVEQIMKKFKRKKQELMAGVRAQISYQVGQKTNIVIKELNRLKEMISIDMKKWATQRADMQLDITRLEKAVLLTQGQTKDQLHQLFQESPFIPHGSTNRNFNSDKQITTQRFDNSMMPWQRTMAETITPQTITDNTPDLNLPTSFSHQRNGSFLAPANLGSTQPLVSGQILNSPSNKMSRDLQRYFGSVIQASGEIENIGAATLPSPTSPTIRRQIRLNSAAAGSGQAKPKVSNAFQKAFGVISDRILAAGKPISLRKDTTQMSDNSQDIMLDPKHSNNLPSEQELTVDTEAATIVENNRFQSKRNTLAPKVNAPLTLKSNKLKIIKAQPSSPNNNNLMRNLPSPNKKTTGLIKGRGPTSK